mgnify:CR=1 FL=1|tara:strand:+ start:2916 stop:3209 length:294 start_codon:yes stop_codon:yes gene_type:complete
MPRAIDMKEPKWYVVSNKNLEEFIQRIEKESGQMVFMAMSVPDYELMAYNLQEIKRFVKEAKQVIVYYKTVTDPDNDTELKEKYFNEGEADVGGDEN